MKTYCINVPNYKTNPRTHFVQTRKSSAIQDVPIYKYAASLIKKFDFKSVLDVGCGYAEKLISYICPLVNVVVGLDTKEMVKVLQAERPEGAWVSLDLENIPARVEQKFDFILCIEVIEHLDDPDKLLDFLKNQAVDSKLILISTPERGKFNPEGPPPNRKHVREWTIEEFEKYLKSSGFCIKDIFPIQNGKRQTIVALCNAGMP